MLGNTQMEKSVFEDYTNNCISSCTPIWNFVHRYGGHFFYLTICLKGQKKSKRFFQAAVSSKKRTNEFYFTTMKPQVNLFSFVFLEETEDTKNTFRNYLSGGKRWPSGQKQRLKHSTQQWDQRIFKVAFSFLSY